MKRRQPNDPMTLLALGAGILGLVAWRLAGRIELGDAAGWVLPRLWIPVIMVACPAGLVGARWTVTRRALRARVSVAVVPADEFDPPAEAIARFAAQLTRVPRSVRGWLDRPASAIRVRLQNDRDGRLVYLLEIPEHARPLLRSALGAYHGIQARTPDPAPPARPEGRLVRAELVLARPSEEPLARLGLDPDPLTGFATALSALHGPTDSAVVCVDLLPATARQRRRLRKGLLRHARRHTDHDPREILGSLGGDGRERRTPADLVSRRADARALDAKVKDAGPLFGLQILLCCRSQQPARARTALRSLLAAFEPLAERNWLRVSGLAIPGLTFLGSDVPGRRWWFDRRLRTGLFSPARRGVVTASEVSGLLKPPTIRCPADNVLRSGALVAPAPALPTFTGQSDLIPLGRVAGETGDRAVGVPVKDTFFAYLAGRSRYGKTETAIGQFLHLVRSGHGGLFLDPHEDALTKIKPYLTRPGVRERVVEINLAGNHAAHAQPAWNLFALKAAKPGETEARVEAIVDAFASALRWDERNSRAINLTTQAAHALAAIARVLPAHLCPTVFQIPTLLSDEDWRRACLPFLPAASRGFWLDRFPRLSEEAITPVTNLIDRLRLSTPIAALLGQSRSTYRVREAMDRRLIVLAAPGSGGTRDRLIANLLVFDLLHAAKTRAELPREQRHPFWVFLDEVQSYDGASSGNLAAVLEQSAKFGIRAFLLNQNPERLTPQTLNAITTNRSHLLATALNARAAALITKEWASQPDPAALTRLDRFNFLAQATHHGHLSKPFHLQGIPTHDLLEQPGNPGELVALEQEIDRTSGRQRADNALAHLDTLDKRIRTELNRRRRGANHDNDDSAPPAAAPASPSDKPGRRRITREAT